MIQKNCCFYSTQALSVRLEEMMAEDKQNVPNVINLLSDENKQKQLLAEDEEENFLDECKFVVYFPDYLQYTQFSDQNSDKFGLVFILQ